MAVQQGRFVDPEFRLDAVGLCQILFHLFVVFPGLPLLGDSVGFHGDDSEGHGFCRPKCGGLVEVSEC